MKYKVVLTKQADMDLRNIYEYIALTMLSPIVAGKQLDKIEKAINSLDEIPYRFKLFEKEPWHSRGLRQLTIDNFIIFYIPRDEDKSLTIIRVLYSGRDIDNQLKETNL